MLPPQSEKTIHFSIKNNTLQLPEDLNVDKIYEISKLKWKISNL